IWQANGLDAAQVMGFTDALVKRRAYLSVWLPPEGERYPRIVFEDACQMITARDPENPQRTLAALKVWCDEWTGEEFANVWLPDAIYKFRKAAPGARAEWVERAEPVVNPVGVVSVFPL